MGQRTMLKDPGKQKLKPEVGKMDKIQEKKKVKPSSEDKSRVSSPQPQQKVCHLFSGNPKSQGLVPETNTSQVSVPKTNPENLSAPLCSCNAPEQRSALQGRERRILPNQFRWEKIIKSCNCRQR